MLNKLSLFLLAVGVVIAFSAFPVSSLINGNEIWTKAGQIAGNKLMAYGMITCLAGGFLTFLDMLLDD